MAAVSLLSEGAGASIATGGRILLSSTSNSSLLWAEESRLQLRTHLHPSKEPLGGGGRADCSSSHLPLSCYMSRDGRKEKPSLFLLGPVLRRRSELRRSSPSSPWTHYIKKKKMLKFFKKRSNFPMTYLKAMQVLSQACLENF